MIRDKLWVNVLCLIAMAVMYIPLLVWFIDELVK